MPHAALAAVFVGCAGATPAPVRDDPGPLPPPSAYAGDFALDQRVTAIHGRGRDTFRAVIEKRGDSLVMVGLGPHGGRAFVLRQQGAEVRFESYLPRELPFSPRYMLLDVHRAWLMGLSDAPLPDGEHRARRDAEDIVEVWADGCLRSRTFRRLDASLPGLLRIEYEGGLCADPARPAPRRVVLDNGWLGYRLVIEDITRRAL